MHSEISKCTQECPQELPEQGACESRVQGYRNKEICKNLQGLCNELQGSPDCLIYFGEGAINRLSDVQTIALKIAAGFGSILYVKTEKHKDSLPMNGHEKGRGDSLF